VGNPDFHHLGNLGYHLHYFYYLFREANNEFQIRYILPETTEIKKLKLKSISYTYLVEKYKNDPYKDTVYSELKYEINDEYALLKIPHFSYYDVNEYKFYEQKLTNFFKDIKKSQSSNLILDLRGNGGGDPNAGNLLLTHILDEPFQYFTDNTPFYPELTQISEISNDSFKGNIFTIIDGGCFSTTGHVLSIMKDQNIGKFIGQESGGGYICSDGSQEINLINTGIKINMAKISYSTNVKGQTLGRGIIPDNIINYTINDYLENKDIEMEFILNNL